MKKVQRVIYIAVVLLLAFAGPPVGADTWICAVGSMDYLDYGENDPTMLWRADLGAEAFSNTVAYNVDSCYGVGWWSADNVYSQDAYVNGVMIEALANGRLLDWTLQPGDNVIFYIAGHGSGDTDGDEYVMGQVDSELEWITDDWLSENLLNYNDPYGESRIPALRDQVNKWVIVDSCHAGGFWGGDGPGDVGDLEKLSRIGLLAACPESGYTAILPNGYTLYTHALIDAFSRNVLGYLHADLNWDSQLTFDELSAWLLLWPEYGGRDFEGAIVYDGEMGDSAVWSRDMWAPVSYTSYDFDGAIAYEPIAPVPVPGAFLLGSFGLSIASYQLRRLKT